MLKKVCWWMCLLVMWLSPLALVQAAEFQSVSPQDLAEVGKNCLIDRLGGDGDYEIAAIYLPSEDIAVPNGQITLQGEIPYGIRLNAPTTVNIAISTDGQLYRSIGLRFNVRKYINVLVASRDIAAHEKFTKECAHYEKRDEARLPIGYIKDLSQIQGFIARQVLREGAVLTNVMLEKPVIVKRGSMITLIARVGNTEVTTLGQTLQNAVAGQVIRVRNLSSKKIVAAQVLDENSAQVLTYNGG